MGVRHVESVTGSWGLALSFIGRGFVFAACQDLILGFWRMGLGDVS